MDSERLRELLKLAADRLKGDWLLIGGALAAVWVNARRTTEDLDLIGLSGTAEERLALMELASEAGLPIEAVNSAADFFVRRVMGWQEEIEPFIIGRTARIFRPTPTLFVLLKMARLSEDDLSDCEAVIAKARVEKLRLDVQRLAEAMNRLPLTTDGALLERRRRLASLF